MKLKRSFVHHVFVGKKEHSISFTSPVFSGARRKKDTLFVQLFQIAESAEQIPIYFWVAWESKYCIKNRG